MRARLMAAWRRGYTGSVRAVAWVRRAPAWLVATIWLAVGLAVGGMLVSSVLALPIFGLRAVPHRISGVLVAPIGEAAAIVGPLASINEGMVQLVWRVTNVGDRVWPADSYRFSPGARDLPVIALPRTVPPRETVTVFVKLSLPSDQEVRELIWHLTGPTGQITGGELIARIDLAGN